MMTRLIKRFISHLPDRWLYEIKRIYYRHQIKKNRFSASEPEFEILTTLVSKDDWAIDVGANIGHYANKLSELVGPKGRVIAFEPIPETFALLAQNMQMCRNQNITLINAAVSCRNGLVSMSIPILDTGLNNYYQAHITDSAHGEMNVMTISLDEMSINHKIALIKIDAEGHEAEVINGMNNILVRDKPTLIVETGSASVIARLESLGYRKTILEGSPNMLFSVEPQQ